MAETIFFRLLHEKDKAAALAEAVAGMPRAEGSAEKAGQGETASGVPATADCFRVDPASFTQVPGSLFAYWVSDRIRRLFKELPPFESEGRTV
jgi:hypothetical protein